MGLFRLNQEQPGPGISKDAPKKKGLFLLGDIYFRAIWETVKLNLLFLLFCLPIVTIGPAYAAMCKITMMLVREKPFFLWSDFLAAFKENWKQGFVCSLIVGVVGTMAFVSVQFYAQAGKDNPLFLLLQFFAAALALLLCLSLVYLYPMLVTFQFSLGSLLKNAVLLGVACLQHALPAVLAIGLLDVLMALFFPLTIPFLLVTHFSFTALVSSFAAWPGMQRYVAHVK